MGGCAGQQSPKKEEQVRTSPNQIAGQAGHDLAKKNVQKMSTNGSNDINKGANPKINNPKPSELDDLPDIIPVDSFHPIKKDRTA